MPKHHVQSQGSHNCKASTRCMGVVSVILCYFTSMERGPPMHRIGGWMDRWALLDIVAYREICYPTKNGTQAMQSVPNHFTVWSNLVPIYYYSTWLSNSGFSVLLFNLTTPTIQHNFLPLIWILCFSLLFRHMASLNFSGFILFFDYCSSSVLHVVPFRWTFLTTSLCKFSD